MKSQMTLKWKLTLSVVLVLVVITVALTGVMQYSLSRTDQKLYSALEAEALANAKTIQSEVTFELTAGLADDVKVKLDEYVKKHDDVHSITVLDKDGKSFASVGQDVDIAKILKSFSSLKKDAAKKVGTYIVAIAPVVSGDDATMTSAQVKSSGCVVYTDSISDYLAFKNRITWAAIGTGVTGLILGMLLAFYIGHRSASPINKLVEAAQRIADGDLEEIEVAAIGSLETSRLGVSIQSMAVALQKQVLAIKRLTGDISSSSKDVAGTMAHLASSASEQAAAVTETAATVEEMEQAGKSAAGNANQIVDAAEKTTEASIRGREAVDTTTAIILKIKDDSQDISDKSKTLLASVEEVGNIIRSVNAIAEQSKILAVNASIEAAKAGEFGSGFAVVAQEVKDLAQQSKDATLQITGTLTAIRQAIENMVETAQSGKERTEEGVNMITNAGAIMNDLSEAIRENSEFANVIATNINQQTVGLTQIATSIEEINSTALENQNISRKIVDSTSQMTASFELLNTMVGSWRTPEQIAEDED